MNDYIRYLKQLRLKMLSKIAFKYSITYEYSPSKKIIDIVVIIRNSFG